MQATVQTTEVSLFPSLSLSGIRFGIKVHGSYHTSLAFLLAITVNCRTLPLTGFGLGGGLLRFGLGGALELCS